MKVELLRLDAASKPSPISEGVVQIQIIYTLQGINLTTQHSRVMKTPRTTIVHDAIKVSVWVLPHPSARLPRDTVTGIHGWPMHYPIVHLLGMVGYHPTQ
jgi:hypothetical protein